MTGLEPRIATHRCCFQLNYVFLLCKGKTIFFNNNEKYLILTLFYINITFINDFGCKNAVLPNL